MVNTKTKLLLLASFFGFSITACETTFQKSPSEISSSSRIFTPEPVIFPGNGAAPVPSSSSSNTVEVIDTTDNFISMANFKATDYKVQVIDEKIYAFGDVVQRADIVNKEWIDISSADGQQVLDLVYFENNLYRLTSPLFKIQKWSKGWENDSDFSAYSPQRLISLGDSLIWIDNTSYPKLHTATQNFEAIGVSTTTTSIVNDIKSSTDELAYCRTNFFWYNITAGAFNSGGVCTDLIALGDYWLAFNKSDLSSASLYEKSTLKKELQLPHDELPVGFSIVNKNYLYFTSANKLYELGESSLDLSNEYSLDTSIIDVLIVGEKTFGFTDSGSFYEY